MWQKGLTRRRNCDKRPSLEPPSLDIVLIILPLPLMKWFCQIFSLYLLTLSCLPCSDGEHEHNGQTTGTTTCFTSANNYSDHENCQDTCSPVCGCHCCSVSFTVRTYPEFSLQKMALPVEKQIFPCYSFYVNDVALAIDHPPQFV